MVLGSVCCKGGGTTKYYVRHSSSNNTIAVDEYKNAVIMEKHKLSRACFSQCCSIVSSTFYNLAEVIPPTDTVITAVKTWFVIPVMSGDEEVVPSTAWVADLQINMMYLSFVHYLLNLHFLFFYNLTFEELM